jgi:20S proteasome subunit beta 5
LFAYGVLDQGYRWDLSVEEACELGRRAIYHATFRDAFSGGTISVYHVSENGWTKMSGTDVGELHFDYYPAEPIDNPEGGDKGEGEKGAVAMETAA